MIKSASAMTVARRLLLSFGATIAVLLVVALLGMWKMSQIQARLTDISDVNNVEMRLAFDMRIAVNQIAIAARDLTITNDDTKVKAEVARIDLARQHYDDAEKKLGRLFTTIAGTTAKERELLEKIQHWKEIVRPLNTSLIALRVDGKIEEAGRLIEAEITPPQRKWLHELGDLADFEEQLNQEAAADAKAAYRTAMALTMAFSVLGLLVAAGAAVLFSRSLMGQLGGEPDVAANAARAIARGDLGAQINIRTNDTTSLMAAMKAMQSGLIDVVSSIRAGADSVVTGSGQIATGNADLSQRTEEQASNLQQTAASMEELSSTVRQNAETAREANRLATQARTTASQGADAVDKVVTTMNGIKAAGDRIANIIGVIDGIAFQTNILALNAAVEAARAGEQGRGFAVVATEVRALAGRSAIAAKEIKQLIAQSGEAVSLGSLQAADAGDTMKAIDASVRHVSDLISEIDSATDEQTRGIEQVSSAVSQLDQVTQQNAALVEESAAAAESLRSQADRLMRSVASFSV